MPVIQVMSDGRAYELPTLSESHRIRVGTHIRPDGWRIGNLLRAGVEGFCDFFLPTNSGGPVKAVAVNVRVVDDCQPRRMGGALYTRVEITFVGDGEPDVICRGWTPYQW